MIICPAIAGSHSWSVLIVFRGSQKNACTPTTPCYPEVNVDEPPKMGSGEVLDAGQRDLPEKHKSARHCDGAEFIYIRLNEQPLMDCSPGCR